MAIAKRVGEPEAGVDMTPMLDIVFIMLIFFIVTTSFVKESGLDVQRPLATTQNNTPTSPPIAIRIDEIGNIIINSRLVDVERVAATIEFMLAENPTDKVVLMASDDTSHQQVVGVMDQVKEISGLSLSIVSNR